MITSDDSWRQQGQQAKTTWIDALKRQGHLRNVISQSADWKDVFLFEAIIEYYLSSDPSEPYRPVNLTCPSGTTAQRDGSWIYLEGTLDDVLIKAGWDTLWLPDIKNHPLAFRIIDISSNRVQIDAPEAVIAALPTQLGRWIVNRRPQLILIDSFGSRVHGGEAVLVNSGTLQLDHTVSALKLNPHFDTIYLAADEARHSKTYRIVGVDHDQNILKLDGEPSFENHTSQWEIPAGLANWLPSIDYDLGPGSEEQRGWDHYHGALFVVYQNTVQAVYPWTSYTSRNFAAGTYLLSSIQGNRHYFYASRRAQNTSAINYAFSVIDSHDSDHPLDAKFYFQPMVTEDHTLRPGELHPGKVGVMMHIGFTRTGQASTGDGTGSAGCLVSPVFYDLRNQLISFYQQEYSALHGEIDPYVEKLAGLSHAQSVALWDRNQSEQTGENGFLPANEWNNKLLGDLWLIRPDERPLG